MPDTALLLMDFQPPMIERLADEAVPLLATVGRAARAARANGLPVVYVRIAFRPAAPEVSPNNRIFTALADASAFVKDEPRRRSTLPWCRSPVTSW